MHGQQNVKNKRRDFDFEFVVKKIGENHKKYVDLQLDCVNEGHL